MSESEVLDRWRNTAFADFTDLTDALTAAGYSIVPTPEAGVTGDVGGVLRELDRVTEALEQEFLFWLTLGPGEVDGHTAAARIRRIVDPTYTNERLASTTPKPCPHGDPYCPCQDGDSCHYEDSPGAAAMACPTPECPACHPPVTGDVGEPSAELTKALSEVTEFVESSGYHGDGAWGLDVIAHALASTTPGACSRCEGRGILGRGWEVGTMASTGDRDRIDAVLYRSEPAASTTLPGDRLLDALGRSVDQAKADRLAPKEATPDE